MAKIRGVTPRWEIISEEMGAEDKFTARDAIIRCSPFMTQAKNPEQAVRDALTKMVKDGTLKRIAYGVYSWTY